MLGKTLYITEKELRSSGFVSGNLDPQISKPYLRVAQLNFVNGSLGKELAQELETQIKDETLTTEMTELLEYVKQCMFSATVRCLYYSSSFKIENAGVTNNGGVDSKDLTLLREEKNSLMLIDLHNMEDYLEENLSLYPLYKSKKKKSKKIMFGVIFPDDLC